MKFLIHTSFSLLVFVSILAISGCNAEDSSTSNNNASNADIAITDPAAPATAKKTRPRIVFFGNSLTAGYGLDEQYSFPSLIQQKIDSLGYSYEVVNAGLSGETTAGGRNRIDWVMEQPIEVFVLELGGNDALRGFELSATRENLTAIIEAVQAKYPEAKVVLAGMEAPPNMGATYTQEFRKIFRELAEKKNTALIPFLLADVGGIAELNLPDRIHPNKEGQVIVANNVWEILAPLLEKQ